jgi:hypothetical protein
VRILGTYQITYSNDVTQVKNLIRHSDFLSVIKPKEERIYDLQILKRDKLASLIKKEISLLFGQEWFTDRSPLWQASKNGIMNLPKHQGTKKDFIKWPR